MLTMEMRAHRIARIDYSPATGLWCTQLAGSLLDRPAMLDRVEVSDYASARAAMAAFSGRCAETGEPLKLSFRKAAGRLVPGLKARGWWVDGFAVNAAQAMTPDALAEHKRQRAARLASDGRDRVETAAE